MTLAAVSMTPEAAGNLLAEFRLATGLTSELKGSRITLRERALFFDLFAGTGGRRTAGRFAREANGLIRVVNP